MIQGYRRGAAPDPVLPRSIPALLRQRGTGEDAARVALRFIDRTTETIASATYGELLARSLSVSRRLREDGVRPGDAVVLLMESRLEFYYALFGSMLIGALPVAVYPPLSLSLLDASLAHIGRVIDELGAAAIVCSQPLYGVALQVRSRRRALIFALDRVDSAVDTQRELDELHDPGDGPVLLQYTSGSLAAPRAIELSTQAIFANLSAIGDAFGMRDGDVGLSWLPLYHDMGLHSVFFALMFRMPAVIMSPLEFLRRPSAWLRAISRYQVTHSPAPNFGYSFAARRIKDADLAGVDLSSWRVAMCGAEPIDEGALSGFAERFAPQGFKADAFMAAYGLAENTVAVSFAPPQSGLRVDHIDAARFAEGVVQPPVDGARAMTVVSVGRVIDRHAVRITDGAGAERPDAVVGEIEVRGPSRMRGYRGGDESNHDVFRDEWLRTGDLGYTRDDELYITGRKKDLIIRGGRNFYPQDIEAAATVSGVRHGCVVAFGVRDELGATEQVVVVAEARAAGTSGTSGTSGTPESASLVERIRTAVHENVGVAVHDVLLVQPGTVPKTSSGKLRRAECRRRYLDKRLVPPSRPGPMKLLLVGAFNLLPARAQQLLDRMLRRLSSSRR